MEKTGKLSLRITKDYCHKEVIELFQKYSECNSLLLFAITSDIDNLGEYIAYNGRAKGQNLVDFYMNVIGAYVSTAQNKIPDLVFIPAGEEVSIFGLVNSDKDYDSFIRDLESCVDERLTNSLFSTASTGITFGGKIIIENHILNKIKKFVGDLSIDNCNTSEEYYNILEQIRTVVSPIVDVKKFKSLCVSQKSDAIFLRNLIYLELLNYKKKTKELLETVTLNKNNLQNDRELRHEYGLTDAKIKRLQNFKDDFISKSIK